MAIETANLHWIYRETMNRLKSYAGRVSEGRDVVAASEFARWLSFSGLIKLFDANPQSEPLKVDGPFMRWSVEQLIQQCNERFRTNSADPNFKAAEFQSLHEKIDKVAGYLSRLNVAPAVAVTPYVCELEGKTCAQESQLFVMPGGLDAGGRQERNRENGNSAEAHRNGAEAVA
jgi:hypothetical protein